MENPGHTTLVVGVPSPVVPQAADPPHDVAAPPRRPTGRRTATLLTAALTVLVGLGGRHPSGVAWALVALAVGGGVLWTSHRRGPLAAASTSLALGVVGVTVGAGMGMPHVARSGLTATSAAGVVTLVAGLVLVGIAATALVLRLRRWWRLLAVPAAVGVVGFVVFPLSLALLVTQVPPLELGADRPSDHGLVAEDVTVRTTDGLDLDAWYVPSTNGAAVVLLPGAGSTRDEELDHAEVLARHGYGVLLLDVRGHAGSDGDAMLWGWGGDADVSGAVTYLLGRPDVVDGAVGVVGMSMGGEQAIGAAGVDERIRAVVAEGASGQGPMSEGSEPRGVLGVLERAVAGTATRAADLLSAAHQPPSLRDALAATAPRPVLVVAAGDIDAEITAGHAFVAAAPGSVTLWVVPDTGHTAALDTHPEEWEARVVAFLDGALR
jgi:uncharacterized protein